MAKNEFDELDILRKAATPAPGEAAKARALVTAMAAYDETEKMHRPPKERERASVLPTERYGSGGK